MNIQDHPIYKEVVKAYDDCGPLQERFDSGKGNKNLSNDDRFEQLANEAMEVRNLGFRASESVTPEIARAIMDKVCPGYNEFESSLLSLLPDDCGVVLAREGSVCIYVQKGKKPIPSRTKLKANEYNVLEETAYNVREYCKGGHPDRPTPCGGFKGELRIWWD